MAYPIFAAYFTCSQHWVGNLRGLGDELGSDCLVQDFVESEGRLWARTYRGEGFANEDWFGWGQDVLSPCDCTVVSVAENPTVNRPGVLGKPPASAIELRQRDGTNFTLVHVAGIRVRQGEQVQRGQVVAQVGNNGFSRAPHIHIGAWRDGKPLQIRFDLEAMGRLLEK